MEHQGRPDGSSPPIKLRRALDYLQGALTASPAALRQPRGRRRPIVHDFLEGDVIDVVPRRFNGLYAIRRGERPLIRAVGRVSH